MSIFSSIFGGARRRSVTVAPSGSVIVPPPVDYGQHVCNSTAMKITAFYAGIRLISENIASLPRSVQRKTDKGP